VLDNHAHWVAAMIGIAIAIGVAAGGPAIDRYLPASAATFAYAVGVAFAALYIMQFIDNGRVIFGGAPDSLGRLLALAILTLALLVAAMLWAIATDNRGALWIAYSGFAIEILALYWRTLGTLLNTSLFFLLAAIIVSALAWAAYRLHLRKTPAIGAAA
jgi:uncharacterized membrane protein